MRRTAAALLLSALVGYIAGSIDPPMASVTHPQARAQSDPLGTPPPNIPPVANPPLYPDSPQKPMHWSIDDLRRIHEARAAFQRANPDRPTQGGSSGLTQPPGTPVFQGQRFRTHNISTNFRAYFDAERPANLTGVMSHYDDVEQHEGVSDFYVFTGGSGQMVVDGVIDNREYRRASGNSGSASLLLPGEFAGQPIKGGKTYTVKAGDWLAIPPNDPHWQLPAPKEGMSYLLLKVNVGIYPGSISR